jgi:serine/threonine protein kinase
MAAAIKIGTIFAGYRIEGVLGRGGMGVVYLAEQPELGRRVAIKVIAPALASDPDYLERFRRESRLAAAIEHPNAIPIYEAGVADQDMPYLVMRYVEGEDLSSLLRREGRLDTKRAAAIVDQIAGALDEAHARGLVHRDVKPANVIVESRRGTEHAYLTDFGLTREMDASSGVTATGRWVGTIDYASPEQIKGRPVDARCDVYALGCVLFTTLTGRLPFERDEDVAKLYAHVSEPPPTASAVVPGVSQEVDRVISRAMAKDPDFRFPSAGDFGRAALAAATGTPVAEPEHTVATGEAAPATEPAPPPVTATPTKPANTPTLAEPESTVEASEARPTAPPSTVEASAARPTAPPAEPPTAALRGEPPRPARAGGRRRLAALAGVLAVGAVIAVAVVALSGGGGGDPKSSSATGGDGGSNTTPDKGGGGRSGNALAEIKFQPFQATAFTVDVPEGWKTVQNELGIGKNVTWTALASPDNQMNVQVQYAPPEPPTEAAKGARDLRQADARYQELTFEQTTIGGREAVLFGYVHSEPEMNGLQPIPEATVFNYYFEDAGLAWRTRAAVSTSEPDSVALAKGIATKMAETLTPTG